MTDRDIMKLALEALEHLQPTALTSFYTIGDRNKAITALREALAQPQQEPVTYMSHNKKNFVSADDVGNSVPNWTDYYPTPLYTTPSTCPTCEALARTVMMDQAGRDA